MHPFRKLWEEFVESEHVGGCACRRQEAADRQIYGPLLLPLLMQRLLQ